MARFNFRQGMARRQSDTIGNPTFLLPSNGGSYIDLIVSPDPTVFIIAHYDVDYMLVENATISKAWGPFSTGTDYWLYWDVDFTTGELTRGFTTREPVHQPSAPSSPGTDQHWFDTTNTVMKVWSGSSWVEKIRVFSTKYSNGAVLVVYPLGSQVAISNTATYAGHILYDPDGKPLQQFQRNRRGRFVTTETELHSQFSRIANFRVESAIVQGEAQEHIPLHYVVAYYDYDKLVLARNGTPSRPAIGLALEEMYTNEIRSYITKGFVTNEADWDWSAYPVGTPLFVGATGQLTPSVPQVGSVQQVAIVVNETTVFVNIQQLIKYTTSGNLLPIRLDRSSGTLAVTDLQAAILDLDDLNDVDISNPQNNEVLTYNSTTSQWENKSPLLSTLGDVNIVSLQDGDTIIYDQSSSKWINVAGSNPPSGFLQVFGYVHSQPSASTLWTINHGLGTDKVVAQVYDSVDDQVFPNNITILDSNNVQIDYLVAQAGRAHLLLFV